MHEGPRVVAGPSWCGRTTAQLDRPPSVARYFVEKRAITVPMIDADPRRIVNGG